MELKDENNALREKIAVLEAETDRITVEDGKKKTKSKDMVLDMNDCAAEMETDPKFGVTCRAGSTSFWMTWDGQMRPCGMMPGRLPIRWKLDSRKPGIQYGKRRRKSDSRQNASIVPKRKYVVHAQLCA